MKLSTASSVLVNYSLPDAVAQIAALGFDGIDLWCGRPHLYRRDYSQAELEAIRGQLEAAGVAAVAVMPAFYRYPHSLSSPIETIRQDSIGYMRDCIDHARFFGAGHVLVVPTNPLFSQSIEDARALFLKSMESVMEYAESKSVMMGLELLNPQLCAYLYTPQQALGLIAELASLNLGAVLDTGHQHLAKVNFAGAVESLGDKLLEVHVDDNDGLVQQNGIPGTGNFDFSKIFSVLEKSGYKGFLTFELGAQYASAPNDALRQSMEYMRSCE